MNEYRQKPTITDHRMTHPAPEVYVKVIATIKGNDRFSSAKFSQDGLSVITTSYDGCQRWDAQSGEFLADIQPDDSAYINQHDFWKQEFQSLKIETEEEQCACDMFRGFADFATTAPNGRLVAVGSCFGNLHLVDLDRAVPFVLDGHVTSMNNHMHQNSIKAMLFDSSSRYIISMSEEEDAPLLWDLSVRGEERIWDKKMALLLKPISLRDFGIAGIDTVHFSPTEPKFVATNRVEETATVWEVVSSTQNGSRN